jgi:hypothetical protein
MTLPGGMQPGGSCRRFGTTTPVGVVPQIDATRPEDRNRQTESHDAHLASSGAKS